MKRDANNREVRCTRREFLLGTAVAVTLPFVATTVCSAAEATLAFVAADKEYHFDTGVLRGVLRPQGRSLGLTSVTDTASGTAVAKAFGFCSHYRLLDAEARYGSAAWDWASESRLLSDGAVQVLWKADREHPFDLNALYRWAAPNTLERHDQRGTAEGPVAVRGVSGLLLRRLRILVRLCAGLSGDRRQTGLPGGQAVGRALADVSPRRGSGEDHQRRALEAATEPGRLEDHAAVGRRWPYGAMRQRAWWAC